MATLASDNFNRADSTNIGADWSEVDGQWQIVSNRLKITTYAGTGIFNFWDYVTWNTALNASPSADYDVSIVFNAPSSAGEPMVGARFTDEDTFYGFQGRVSGDNWSLFKVVGGVQTELDTGAFTFNATTDYTLKISCIGTAIKAFIDGSEVSSVTDGDVTLVGKPIVCSDIVDMIFDDFLVTGTSATLGARPTGFMTTRTMFWGD